MPAGNVTVNVDYYPQATAAEGALTAATGVAATTSAPLVTLDATMLTGATKLMYLANKSTDPAPGYDAQGILGQVTGDGHGLILALKNAANQSWNTIKGWSSVTEYGGITLKQLPEDALGSLTCYTTLGEIPVSNWGVANYGPYSGIFQNLDSNNNLDVYLYDNNVNAYITGAGGTALSGTYISLDDDGEYAYDFDDTSYGPTGYSHSKNVRPIIAF